MKRINLYMQNEELFEELKIYCIYNKIKLYQATEKAIDEWLTRQQTNVADREQVKNEVVIPNASKIVKKKSY